jgi:NAD(P)-dependent dehydrogenase (short-subunit alcohol dehydrogenase family)
MAPKDDFALTDKVVLITGAASGIGRAAAHAFSAAGARLALADIQAEALVSVRDEITATGHPAPLAVPTDVASDTDLQNLVKSVLDVLGSIDVLINNAGLGLGGRFQDNDPARLRRVVEVNLYGVMRLTQLVIPVMLERGAGHILNVTSQAAALAVPGYAGYSATKAGIAAFTQIMRRELVGTGIHFTSFCPGPTKTPMTEPMIEFGKGTARMPHHGPELPAAQMVDAVRRRRKHVVTSQTPRRQAIVTWLEKLFPTRLDSYWKSQLSDDFFDGASRSGEQKLGTASPHPPESALR